MPIITSPGRIGKLELKNRILMAPMGPHFGEIGRKAVEYFGKRAEGGAAMILVNMMVTDYFEDTSSSLVITEDNFDNFKEICEFFNILILVVFCQLFIQLAVEHTEILGSIKNHRLTSFSGCLYDFRDTITHKFVVLYDTHGSCSSASIRENSFCICLNTALGLLEKSEIAY